MQTWNVVHKKVAIYCIGKRGVRTEWSILISKRMNFFFKYVTETVDSPFMVKKSIWVRNDEIGANGVSTSLNPSQHALSMINDKAVIDLGIDHDRSFRGLSEWCIYLEIRRCVLLLFRASKLKANEETKKTHKVGTNKSKIQKSIDGTHIRRFFMQSPALVCSVFIVIWHWVAFIVSKIVFDIEFRWLFLVFSAHIRNWFYCLLVFSSMRIRHWILSDCFANM